MGRKIRYVKNESNHPLLVKGKFYTINGMAREVKIPQMTLRNRLGLLDVVTDEHFIDKKRKRVVWPQFESKAGVESAKWLKRAL